MSSLTSYVAFILVLALQLALLAQATDLLAGHTGRTGLTASVFAGVAGYFYAIATVKLLINPWLAVCLALLSTLPVSLFIGYLLLKLDTQGFLIASFALQVALVDLMRNLTLTGGPLGIRDIPAPSLLSFGGSTIGSLLVVIPGVILATTALTLTLGPRSDLGRLFHWIRDDNKSATAFGVRSQRLLQSAFTVHAIISAIAGISFVIAQTYVGPNSFDLWLSLNVLAVVFLSGTGGATSLMLVGASMLVCLIELVNFVPLRPEAVGPLQKIIFNLLLVGILVFQRRGIGGPILEANPSAEMAE